MITIDQETEDRIRRINRRTGLDPARIVEVSVRYTEDKLYELHMAQPELPKEPKSSIVEGVILDLINDLIEGLRSFKTLF